MTRPLSSPPHLPAPQLCLFAASLSPTHPPKHPQTAPPDATKIPEDDLLGATVVMITCSFRGVEFIRVGYWVANAYAPGGVVPEVVPGVPPPEPPKPCDPGMIVRAVLADKPRVTRFPIDWSDEEGERKTVGALGAGVETAGF